MRVAAVAGTALTVVLFLHGVPGIGLPSIGWDAQYRVDLDVYRLGALAWLAGDPLYDPGFPVTELGEVLPFVYPPIAAVLFVPLTWLPMPAAASLLSVVSAAVLVAVTAALVRALGHRVRGWWLAAATPLVLLTDPVRLVLLLGQVNLLLVGLVWAGLLGRGRWRGVAVGIAAAVKLTPLVFVVWFLLVGDRRAAATAAGTVGVLTGLGVLAAPADSLEYWSSTVIGLGDGTGTVLDLAYAGNQSLRAVVERWGLPDGATSWSWATAAGAAGIGALLLARRCVRAREPLLGAGVLAVAGLLVSPISWSHHWVWALPVLPVLAEFAVRHGSRAPWWVLGAGVVPFAVGPHWLLPHDDGRERAWSVVEQVVGAHLPLWGATVLVVVGGCLWAPAARPMSPDRGDGRRPRATTTDPGAAP